jgi:hypothetical protein
MSVYRTILVACAIACVTVFTSAAFAQCGGCGAVAVVPVQPVLVQPVVEVQPIVVEPAVVPVVPVAPAPIGVSCWDTNGSCGGGCGGGGCGGCGGGGCGGFGGVGGFGGLGGFGGGGCGGGGCGGCGGGGCGGCGGCSSTFGYHPVAPAPLYVVNQGPEYSGPGLMVPFGTYSPATNVAAPGAYPYVAGRGYGYGPRYPRPYYGSRYTYTGRYWGNPSRYYPNRWRG